MLACSEPGRTVYLSRHKNPKRRLRYTWEMIEMPTSLVGVNTLVPNRLVRAAILAGKIERLTGYDHVRSEVRYGRNSRIDLLLERGLKHLKELQDQIRLGDRSVIFYLIQRMDARLFRPADHIDPVYGQELRKAIKNGVEIMVYDVTMDLKQIQLNREIPFET
jgi:sugar fermentation stimulation protein A